MDLKPLRAAVIGCGKIGTFTVPELRQHVAPGFLPMNHAESIRSVPGVALAALCDTNRENLDRAVALHGAVPTFSSYREMIRDIAPDLLFIATRTAVRREIMEFAAANGVRGMHVEKPLSTNMRDCREVLSLLSANEVAITYGTTRRFMEMYHRARELVESGKIGTLNQISVELGRAPLLWAHPHSADIIRFFAGAANVEYVQGNCVAPVAALVNQVLDADPIVTSATVQFDNGVSGLITAKAGGNVTLCGSKGNLTVVGNGSWIRIDSGPGAGPNFLLSERIDVKAAMSGTQRAVFELARFVRDGVPVSMAPSDIEGSQELLFGIAFSSVNGGRRVKPAEIPEDFTVTGRMGENYA